MSNSGIMLMGSGATGPGTNLGTRLYLLPFNLAAAQRNTDALYNKEK